MKKKIIKSLIVVLVLALTCIYVLPGCTPSEKDSDVVTADASFHFDEEEVLRQLKEKNIDYINKDLVKDIRSEKLSGPVNVVITLSTGSLVGQYNQTDQKQPLNEYLASGAAQAAAASALARQEKLEKQLVEEGLISSAKYHYSSVVDGFAVSTTYENLAKIIKHDGVYSVIIGKTYEPEEAIVNDVNVYDTGIFQNNVSDQYTGEGTIVAILDTGCDYAHPAFTTHEVSNPRFSRSDIESILPDTIANSMAGGNLESRQVYYGDLTKNKIAFGYDYADNDADVMPFLSEHGTHVAGIIGGYAEESIYDKNDDFDGSRETYLQGVAIDTQFAIMKVFSDYRSGAEDEDILAALEDCVKLGVDAINMSLGASAGFAREYDDEEKNRIYDEIADAGISLIVAASNDYSSAYGSEFGNTNKVSNPDSGTVGSPATYTSALSVASINGNKEKYMTANGERVIFFQEAADMGTEYYDFFEKLGVTDSGDHTFEYVTIPGLGAQSNYSAVDVRGKIALVKRGDLSFEEKVINAALAGAAGVIIYNNVYGDILMTVAEAGKEIAVCSIGKDDGEYLAEQESGTLVLNAQNTAGPFMSDFSSWGPNPDLSLKPEITAHGGNIWSAIPGGGYEKLSGTSMACPNLVGIAVLARQYVNARFADEDLSVTQKRDLVNQLLMSTATIVLNKEGNPYSPRKQGAGIADILKATTTPAYLYTKDKNGEVMNTTKLELWDDPARAGVYQMTFYLRNISDGAVSYKLGNYTFTESLSADKKYVAEMAYMLSHNTQYAVAGDGTLSGDVVTVPAGQTAEITVKITLSAADKAYLNDSFVNGMYVEGFVTLDSQAADGVDLNVPFLAFYGDWGEAPIFDKDYYEVETTAHNNAIDDEDKIKADYTATTPYALYYYDYIIPMGTYLYDLPAGYNPIPATEEHAALSYQTTTLSQLYAIYAGLLRNAKQLHVEIRNTSTGETVWTMDDYNCYKAHFNGSPMPYVCEMELSMFDFDILTVDPTTGSINGAFGNNNEKFEVTMTASLDWESERNARDTYTFSFYVDTEAPTVTGYSFRSKYNTGTRKWQYYLDLEIYDNHYAMSARPIVINQAWNADGTPDINEYGEQMIDVQPLNDNAIPIYQETRSSTTKLEVEITNYIDNIRNSLMPDCILFMLDDYALNNRLIRIPLPETDNKNLDIDEEHKQITLDIGQTLDLTPFVVSTDPSYTLDVSTDQLNTTSNHIEQFFSLLDWNTEDESVAAIHGGIVEGRKQGSTTVSFTSGGETHTIQVTVTDRISDDRSGYDQVGLEEVKFSGYDTLHAFTSDIDYSDIGETGSVNYFSGSASISFYPSEVIRLKPQIKPWNLEGQLISDDNDGSDGEATAIAQTSQGRYKLIWRTTDPRVATVTSKGEVTAQAEGNCRITLSVELDGKENVLQASCAVNVKSEFVINDSRQLIAYKGWGGDVVIPDDEGLMYINSFAFCHFSMDNSVELPEDDKYNLDLKRTPYDNTTVTSVTIPDTVTSIEAYAFYHCIALEKVIIGEDSKLTTIALHAFDGCDKLTEINLDNVHMINDYAFYHCEKLSNVGSNKLARPYGLGASAFEGCKSLTELNLANLRRSSLPHYPIAGADPNYSYTFKDCTGLTTVTLGEFTRLTEGMFEGCTGLKHSRSNPLKIYSDVIPERAFYGCINLRNVEIVKDVTYLGDDAFNGCTRLESVVFDGNCEQFAANAFVGCNGLTTFKIGQFNVEDGVVYNADKTVLLYVVPTMFTQTSFTLPASVTEIVSGAFSGSQITSFDASGSALRIIGSDAFNSCTRLNRVTLPATVESIGNGAFASTALRTINLGDTKIEKIGDETFMNDTSLTSVTLPTSCTKIGDHAFAGCNLLTTVDLLNITEVGRFAFENTALTSANFGEKDVTIGEGAFAGQYGYRLNTETNSFDLVVTKEGTLTSVTFGGKANIGDYAFVGTRLKSVTIETEGSEIGNYAFACCVSLTEAEINGVTKLGSFAFYMCSQIDYNLQRISGLTTVSMNNVTEIGESAFEGDCALQTVRSKSLIKIGVNAFYPRIEDGSMFLMNVSSIDFDNVTEIGEYAFFLNTSLTSIQLPKVEKIGDRAFFYCENLTNVVALNLKELGMGAFGMCSSLASFVAPDIEKIGSAAFSGTLIETINVGDKLTEADGAISGAEHFRAFTHNGSETYNGTGIRIDKGVLYIKKTDGMVLTSYPTQKTDRSYNVLDGTVRIGFMAAMNNRYLTELTLPASLNAIGDYAFAGCVNLERVVFQSYYAPALEGVANVLNEIRTTPPLDPEEEYMQPGQFPYLDDLYKYDFYFNYEDAGEISYYYSNAYYYSHFYGWVGQKKLTMQIPSNSSGYDSPIYKAFFNEERNAQGDIVYGEETMGRYAIEFIRSVRALQKLSQVDRYATNQINDAITAYNMLQANKNELRFVDGSYIDFYNSALQSYNVDIALHAITHLFDMDDTVYSYKALSSALQSYNALNSEGKAALNEQLADAGYASAKNILDEKSAEYRAASGFDGEIDKDYIDHVVDLLSELFGDLKPEEITEEHFDLLVKAYSIIHTLTDEEIETYETKLKPYQAYIDAWNKAANDTGVIDTAEVIAHAPINGLFATVAGLNVLLAAAYVVLKGGIL